MSEEKEKWTVPGPYHSTTKRDGVEVPVLQTIFQALLFALVPLILIPLIAYGVDRYGGGLPMEFSFYIYIGGLLFVIVFLVAGMVIWPQRRADFLWIMQNAMVPGDANGNGIPDELEAVVEMLTMDGNGDGVPDLMDILRKYNGGSSTLFVTLQDPQGNQQHDELPYAERLPTVAREYQRGKPLTVRVWTGGKDALFQPHEWAKLVADLKARGYAVDKNPDAPNLGIDLTDQGKTLFAGLVGEGARIERDTNYRKPTYSENFQWRNPRNNPSPAD